jgi:hypothetical protein
MPNLNFVHLAILRNDWPALCCLSTQDSLRILTSPKKIILSQQSTLFVRVADNWEVQVWRDATQEPVTIWRPRAPQGYVALGCVVVPDYYEPDQGTLSCVRQDCVAQAPLQQAPISKHATGSEPWQCTLWRVHNNASTFLALRDHRPPPPHLAYKVVQ